MKRLTKNDKAVIEAAQIVLKSYIRDAGVKANDPKAAVQLARNEIVLSGAEREHLFVLYLDSRHQLIESKIMFSGTIDGSEVYPRVIAQHALHINAAAIIMAHNHPSGELQPSTADHAMTTRVKQSLALFDIRVLDHLIITHDSHTSFAEKGWL